LIAAKREMPFDPSEFDADDFFTDEQISRDLNKDLLLLAIDCSTFMHQAVEVAEDGGEKSSSAIKMALETVLTLYKSKALVSSNDEVGLVFFGTVHY
jgi:hypothetical protein